jgi:hypothetical protein
VGGLFERLEAHCEGARHELVLVAPFIKQVVLRRLLDAIPPSVPVRVVTRWLPQDIASGVCDLEIWDEVVARPGTGLWVRSDLHAKFYRADGDCLVGSANITGAGLGLGDAPNLELLVPVRAGAEGVEGFEEELFSGAIAVDEDLVAATRALVDQLPKFLAVEAAGTAEPSSPAPAGTVGEWLPQLRQPEDLFLAYSGAADVLSAAALRTAIADLAVLRVPPGLDASTFRAFIGVALLRLPLVRQLDEFVVEPRRFGEVRDFLQARAALTEPASRVWQVLFRWLMLFLPERYEYLRPRHSELIVRRGSR